MSEPERWPICLALTVGTTRLMLPAALFEQTLACNPVPVPPARGAGWQLLGSTAGNAFAHLGFGAAGDEPWEASWLAVFRRLPQSVAGTRRVALVMSEAPRVLPPLAASLTVAQDAAGADGAARVRLDGEEMLVPDLNGIAAALDAGAASTGDTP